MTPGTVCFYLSLFLVLNKLLWWSLKTIDGRRITFAELLRPIEVLLLAPPTGMTYKAIIVAFKYIF